mmetsp:Transcript_64041/g.111587  ORF Transcript_64041/g.111587 Transcript_64041/m.111587 type:complete len:200 (+) Transcript_64041:708-1307(+)
MHTLHRHCETHLESKLCTQNPICRHENGCWLHCLSERLDLPKELRPEADGYHGDKRPRKVKEHRHCLDAANHRTDPCRAAADDKVHVCHKVIVPQSGGQLLKCAWPLIFHPLKFAHPATLIATEPPVQSRTLVAVPKCHAHGIGRRMALPMKLRLNLKAQSHGDCLLQHGEGLHGRAHVVTGHQHLETTSTARHCRSKC